MDHSVFVALYCGLDSSFVSIRALTGLDRRSGWDIHDTVYSRELGISNKQNGYRDVLAKIDLSTYRRIPWDNNVPFFLVSYLDPVTQLPLYADPRSLLQTTCERASALNFSCMAGVEYEVFISVSVGHRGLSSFIVL